MGLILLIAALLILAGVFISFFFRLTFSKANLTFWGACVVVAVIYLAVSGQLK